VTERAGTPFDQKDANRNGVPELFPGIYITNSPSLTKFLGHSTSGTYFLYKNSTGNIYVNKAMFMIIYSLFTPWS
jgi:hypothetical protein